MADLVQQASQQNTKDAGTHDEGSLNTGCRQKACGHSLL
jgi:hypothetical protein